MVRWANRIATLLLLLCLIPLAYAADARFDLLGPKIDVRVTRGSDTLPIASVPNLQPGDRLWLHPDLPATQSVKYLLICVFLRGNTNPPPENWFFRVETWNKKVRDEGVFVTVPDEAQQAVLFMAPETGGDFSTLKSAVRGRPGVFVRASQDLAEAGFEQARIERYVADMRRVSPSDTAELQKRSDLLARVLALKPNPDCFKRPVDQQFACLTQTGSQLLLDDGHGQSVATAISNGSSSDLINQASYTRLAGAGDYSAYVGAIIDVVRIMGSLHTAQYQYIPAIAFPQGEALNLRLNTPPSFHNPKSVLVIGLPGVQAATKPPLRPTDPSQVACLLQPSLVLQVDGAPLVFSNDFATRLVLHLNTPVGAPVESDIPLQPDAFEGGLVVQQNAEHHVPLRDEREVLGATASGASDAAGIGAGDPKAPTRPEPITLTGTVEGRWGFDPFTGPTLKLQQRPGGEWHIVSASGGSPDLIAGKSAQLLLASSGSACVHTVSADLPSGHDPVSLAFKQQPSADQPNVFAISLPADRQVSPGSLHLQIQQYGQPQPDGLAAKTFADPPHVDSVQLPAADKTMLLLGTNLGSIEKVSVGDLTFRPQLSSDADEESAAGSSLRLSLCDQASSPPTHAGDHLSAHVTLNDGRELPLSLTVLPARPSVTLLSRSFDPVLGSVLNLSSSDDLPLSAHLNFTLKSKGSFPRNGRIEVQTLDGTLRAVLTLAPSGGLVLQDPHTVVAGLDPLRSFGPSAFGALQARVVFPSRSGKVKQADPDGSSPTGTETSPASSTSTANSALDASDWMPLGTLVRLPGLLHLQCSLDLALPCNLTGTNLFLVQAVSADPAFSNPDPVPDGFTGGSLPVPHPAGSTGTLFFKLRDDPSPIDSASVPTTVITTQASTSRGRGAAAHN